MKYMLDTNICIYVMNERPPEIKQLFNQHMGQLCISSITLAELHYGAHRSSKAAHNLSVINEFCKHLEVLPFDEEASAAYGVLRAVLQGQGVPIGSNDMLIAAHAIALGLVIVTNNEKEFSRVQGLSCENWVSTLQGK